MTTAASSTVTGSNFFRSGVKYASNREIPRLTRTAIAGKTTLKKWIHITFWVFIAIIRIPAHLLFKCRRTLLKLKSCSKRWRQRNVQKRSVTQIVQKFSSFPCVLLVLGYSNHLLKCILLTVYYILLFCVIMAVFFTSELDVVPDTEFEDHNRKLSLLKLPRVTKKSWNALVVVFCFKHWGTIKLETLTDLWKHG